MICPLSRANDLTALSGTSCQLARGGLGDAVRTDRTGAGDEDSAYMDSPRAAMKVADDGSRLQSYIRPLDEPSRLGP